MNRTFSFFECPICLIYKAPPPSYTRFCFVYSYSKKPGGYGKPTGFISSNQVQNSETTMQVGSDVKLQQIQKYFSTEAVSQSLLKQIERGVHMFERNRELYYSDKPHFDRGSVFDVLVTTPALFDDMFAVLDGIKPTGKFLSAVTLLWDTHGGNGQTFADLEPEVLQCARMEGVGGSSWSDERVMAQMYEKCETYWNEMEASVDKTIVSEQLVSECKEMVGELTLHPWTSELIYMLDNPEGYANLEVHTQYPVYWKTDEFECKALLDILVVNHGDEDVKVGPITFRPKSCAIIDLKSTGDSVVKFPRSAKRFGYHHQMAWYRAGVSQTQKYKAIDCYNIVKSVDIKEYPMIYKYTSRDLDAAMWGVVYNNNNAVTGWEIWQSSTVEDKVDYNDIKMMDMDVPGLIQMLHRYRFHVVEDDFTAHREALVGNGLQEMQLYD